VAGGIELLTHIAGFDRVLVGDAVKTPGAAPGQVRTFKEGDFEETLHASSPHSTNFAAAMAMGRAMHTDEMPGVVAIVGVAVERVHEFTEEMAPAVEAAVPVATEEAARVLRGWGVPVA
jgi:hydrogenase maturation protease